MQIWHREGWETLSALIDSSATMSSISQPRAKGLDLRPGSGRRPAVTSIGGHRLQTYATPSPQLFAYKTLAVVLEMRHNSAMRWFALLRRWRKGNKKTRKCKLHLPTPTTVGTTEATPKGSTQKMSPWCRSSTKKARKRWVPWLTLAPS